MISPEEIRRKAEKLYDAFLVAWLNDEPFFPRAVPTDRSLDAADPAGAIAAIDALRAGAKETLGFGYSIEWVEKNSRRFGRNRFPVRIYFETADDWLRLIRRQRDFTDFHAAVERLRAEFPELESWMRSHRALLAELAPQLEGLMGVLQYFRRHPRPAMFVRELPLGVDSKFVERHESVLRDWLDRILPPAAIRADETHFARRFGLRFVEWHVLTRFLDEELQREVGSPWPELSLPIGALAELSFGEGRVPRVIIVENKVNLLTLPRRARSLAFGGLGRAAVELRRIGWLHQAPIDYWGDLDVEGFQILSALRADLPHVRSLGMDVGTLERFRGLAVPGNNSQSSAPVLLTAAELAAFEICRRENLRIEQERFPCDFDVTHTS